MCRSILTYLPQVDLVNICLVHRNLRTLAEPYLYSELCFTWKEYQPHPITALLRSILHRPQLANYVHKLSLVGASFYMPHYGNKAPKIPISEFDLEGPLAFVAKTRGSYRDIWLDELRNGTMDAFVAVLLAQPLRLTYLFIGPDFLKESRFIGLLLRSTLCETLDYGLRVDFGRLETVCFERFRDVSHRYSTTRNTADVLPLFYLPCVKRISAVIDNPVPITFSWPAAHPPSCSTLRSLKLLSIREAFLGHLLLRTDQLEFLHWEWYHNPEFKDQVQTPVINLTQVTTAMSYIRDTLSELVVSALCNLGRDPEYPILSIQGSFRALREFDKLRKFTVPLALLMGFSADMKKRIEDFLPQNLEFLTISDDLYCHEQFEWQDHELFAVLESWLETFQTSTPRLYRVELFLKDLDIGWNQPIRDKLRQLGVRVGIEVEVTKLSKDNDNHN